MKRGNALIVLLVLFASVSIFSTGLYANFLDTFTGNSFSFVTGNMVGITGEAGAPAETDINPKVKGEHCTADRDCYSYSSPQISNACRGTNNYCYDQLPAADEQPKRGIGRICNSNSQCSSGKCSNGICGKKRGETCANSGQCLSGDCFGGQCDYSNVNTGNNANDLCSIDTDCKKSEGYRCSSFHRCVTIASLKKTGESCISNGISYNQKCLSGVCTDGKCSKSAGGKLCSQHTDCTDGFVCESYNKRCTAKQVIGGLCEDSSQCPGSNTNPNPNSCYKKAAGNQFGICGLKQGETCANEFVCLSKTCTTASHKCAKSDAGEFCLQNSDCINGNCGNSNKCGAGAAPPKTGKPNGEACTNNNDCQSSLCSPVPSATQRSCGKPSKAPCTANRDCASLKCTKGACDKPVLCNSWKQCKTNEYCTQSNKCTIDDREIIFPNVDRECAGDYQTKIGKGETCKKSFSFSLGNEANKQWFLKSGCTANSQCKLTIKGEEIYNYCRKDGFCDARLFTDGRGCNTEPNKCAIDELCNAATNKCELNPDVATNDHLERLKAAINNALNFLLPRIQGVVRQHDLPIVGLATLGEWRTSITEMGARMQSIEDQICAESFRHPEIENEGLPCTQQVAGQLAQAPVRTPQIRPAPSIFDRLGLFRVPQPQIPGANP